MFCHWSFCDGSCPETDFRINLKNWHWCYIKFGFVTVIVDSWEEVSFSCGPCSAICCSPAPPCTMTDVSGLGRAKVVVVSFWVEVYVEEEEVGHSHKVKMGEVLMGTKFQTNVIDWVKSWWVGDTGWTLSSFRKWCLDSGKERKRGV